VAAHPAQPRFTGGGAVASDGDALLVVSIAGVFRATRAAEMFVPRYAAARAPFGTQSFSVWQVRGATHATSAEQRFIAS
jgi:hypothetical protein